MNKEKIIIAVNWHELLQIRSALWERQRRKRKGMAITIEKYGLDGTDTQKQISSLQRLASTLKKIHQIYVDNGGTEQLGALATNGVYRND